jgi:alpha-beta hydrolase superfamily lysophospholipase
MTHSEGSFKCEDNLSLFYQKWIPEDKSKAVIAIVHGIGEHCGRYMTLVDHFVPLGYTIYGFDQRGHGRSPGKRGHLRHWQEFRSDMKNYLQLIRTECEDLPLFLLGHSLGGLVVLDFALHNPEGIRAVIASSPALSAPGIPPLLITLSKIMSRIWPGLSIETHLDVSALSHDPAVISAYQNDPLVHGLASARMGTEFNRCRETMLADAAGFKLPLLIYHGKSDRIVPYEGSLRFYEMVKFKDKELHLFDEGYHELHHDTDKEKVFLLVEDWIKKHLKG